MSKVDPTKELRIINGFLEALTGFEKSRNPKDYMYSLKEVGEAGLYPKPFERVINELCSFLTIDRVSAKDSVKMGRNITQVKKEYENALKNLKRRGFLEESVARTRNPAPKIADSRKPRRHLRG